MLDGTKNTVGSRIVRPNCENWRISFQLTRPPFLLQVSAEVVFTNSRGVQRASRACRHAPCKARFRLVANPCRGESNPLEDLPITGKRYKMDMWQFRASNARIPKSFSRQRNHSVLV